MPSRWRDCLEWPGVELLERLKSHPAADGIEVRRDGNALLERLMARYRDVGKQVDDPRRRRTQELFHASLGMSLDEAGVEDGDPLSKAMRHRYWMALRMMREIIGVNWCDPVIYAGDSINFSVRLRFGQVRLLVDPLFGFPQHSAVFPESMNWMMKSSMSDEVWLWSAIGD